MVAPRAAGRDHHARADLALTGIEPRQWAAVHRKHHKFADAEGDPHSPYVHGFWRDPAAELLLLPARGREPGRPSRASPATWSTTAGTACSLRTSLGLLLFAAILVVAFGPLLGLLAFVAHALVRLPELVGERCRALDRLPALPGSARNIWLLALLTSGEGLHNNHHEFPGSSRFAQRWWEIDPGWYTIATCAASGLAQPHRRSRSATDGNGSAVPVRETSGCARRNAGPYSQPRFCGRRRARAAGDLTQVGFELRELGLWLASEARRAPSRAGRGTPEVISTSRKPTGVSRALVRAVFGTNEPPPGSEDDARPRTGTRPRTRPQRKQRSGTSQSRSGTAAAARPRAHRRRCRGCSDRGGRWTAAGAGARAAAGGQLPGGGAAAFALEA